MGTDMGKLPSVAGLKNDTSNTDTAPIAFPIFLLTGNFQTIFWCAILATTQFA